ncbi:hypothetical protein HanRHA438_Chr12g0568061 [Helianthus annuus]|nr:hypothetical protein HanRHA438_Chr12g0568061 [Helianthus annuus]
MESPIPKGIPFPQNYSFHPHFFFIPSPLAPFINTTTTYHHHHHPPLTPSPPPATISPQQPPPPPPTRHRYHPQL